MAHIDWTRAVPLGSFSPVSSELGSQRSWLRVGGAGGIVGTACYLLLIVLPAPTNAQVALTYGFALGFALLALAVGDLVRGVAPRLAAVGVVGGVLGAGSVLSMILVQLAAKARPGDVGQVVAVWLGLDVVWDLYIGTSLLVFAAGMWLRGGAWRIAGAVGVPLAIAFLFINVWTFPVPPGEAGLIDLGPFAAFWYLGVAIAILWSSRGAAAGS